jgi:hypothetical protein
MKNDSSKTKSYGFDCVSKPIPPGTKSHGRLARPGDPEPHAWRMRVFLGALVIAALIGGVMIGRLIFA